MIALVLVLSVVACWPSYLALHGRWTDWNETTYTHGYLIAIVCVFLLWRANTGRPPALPRPSPARLVALLAVGVLWAVAVRSGLVALELVLLPAISLMALWAGFGGQVARRSLFALAYMYFALPLWGALNGLFQSATVYAVRAALRALGIPSHFEGNIVQIPAGVFEIAGGCSGLHFVMVGLALAALMGELRGDTLGGRVKLLVLAGSLAVLCNWVRVLTLILAGHFTDMQHYLITESHYFYGWGLFAVAMAVFFFIERRIEAPAPVVRQMSQPAAPGTGIQRAASVPGVVLALGTFSMLQVLSARPAVATGITTDARIIAESMMDDVWKPDVVGADQHEWAELRSTDGFAVLRHRFTFLSHRQGKELGGFTDDVTRGYQRVGVTDRTLGAVPVTLHEVRDEGGSRWLVAASYRTGRRYHANALQAQIRYGVMSVARLRSQIADVTLWRVPCTPDCRAAEQSLARFLAVP